MPRKAKEKEIVIEENDVVVKDVKSTAKAASTKAKATVKKAKVDSDAKKTTTKKTKADSTTKKTTTKKSKEVSDTKKTTAKKAKATSTDVKPTTKKVASKKTKAVAENSKVTKTTKTAKTTKATTKKVPKESTKKSTTKSTTPTKKATTKSTKKSSTSTKKSTTKKTTSKTTKTTKSTKSKSTKAPNLEVLEYYDLPYKYGNTLVKLLAQTPKTLFIYWEISDLDIENYKKQFGEDFFNVTKPILIVHNLTLDKTYEVEINDFANCWYLTTEDADCKFDIELARKFIGTKSSKKTPNAVMAKSNNLEAPNDHVLFEKLTESITFKNTKTGKSKKEEIKDFDFLNDLYKFYKDMYKDEFLKNPSSKINI